MRIGIIALQHESNTFIHAPTTLANFQREALATGPEIAAEFADAHHEVGGFFEGCRAAGAEAVPIFAAWAVPSGVITAETYNQLLDRMMRALDGAGRLDGLLVAPHGAGVCESQRDMDGHWLSLVRQRVGAAVPIVCTLDPHANLTARMLEACNATLAYRTNPHLDQRQTGLAAAELLVRTGRGEVRPTQAAAFPRVAINIERQQTSQPPCRPMYDAADAMLDRPGVLHNSILLGFPYADVAEMGSAFVVVTDNDAPLAQRCADEMADYLWNQRRDFVAELIGVEEALDRAARQPQPVCLLDMGDNIGGGSSADGTVIAHALLKRGRSAPKAFVAIRDPDAAQQARAAGVGAKLSMSVGGKTDDLHGPPLHVQVTVKALHEGDFTEDQARHGGRATYHIGPNAVVETDNGLTIQLTSLPAMPFSLGQLRCCGLDPASFAVLVAKGVVAPVAAYAEVCPTFIRVNTPGSTTADMLSLPYRHRRRPLFPFEEPTDWRA